jgi:PAS domain S-box-containing protein
MESPTAPLASLQPDATALTALVRAMTRIHSSRDADDVLHIGLTTAQELVNAEFGGVFVFDDHAITLKHKINLQEPLLTHLQQFTLAPDVLMQLVPSEQWLAALEQHLAPILARHKVSSFILLPLLARQRPLGVILLGAKHRTLTRVCDELLYALGEHIGTVLETTQLYTSLDQTRVLQELHRRTQEQTTLNTIARILNHPLEFDQRLEQVCEQITSIIGMESVVLYLLDEAKQCLALRAHYGLSPSLLAQARCLGLDDPAVALLICEGRYIALDADTLFPSATSFAGPRAEGYRAGIGVPILQRGVPVGAIYVGSKVKTRYQQSDIDLLQNIANQIGVALDNARLYTQAQQRLRELEALFELGTALVSNLDPQAIADIAAEWIYRLFNCDVVDVSLLREGKLYALTQRVTAAHLRLTEPIPLGALQDYFASHRAVLIVHDLHQDAAVPTLARELMHPRGLRALLVMPMIAHEQMLGTLAVVHSQPRTWSVQEQHLLQTIANHMANALHNAQLYQQAVIEKRKVEAIFESGLSGMFVTDAQGRIVMFNRAAERITGWTFEEIKGKDWEGLLSDRAAGNPIPSLLEQALRHRKTLFAFEGRRLRTRDGRIIPVARAAAPLLDEKDNLFGAVGAFWDLSKERRAEIEYENFVAMVTHQIRSPLASILSALELFERQSLSEERRAQLWALIKTEGHHLKRLADQFLTHQRILQRERLLQIETLDLVPILHQLIDKFRLRNPTHHFHLQIVCPDPLVRADAQYLVDILHNLLDNAVVYAPPTSPIHITVQPFDSEWLVVSVQDFGVGIPLNEQKHLFQPFYRVPQNSERRVYGHGLGLALVKEMVEALGGKVWVESEAGQGATFYFTLRRAA